MYRIVFYRIVFLACYHFIVRILSFIFALLQI